MTPNRFLEDTITNSIVGEDELADSASPELASIRRHMRATESKVRDILQKLISSNQSKYLQEAIHHHTFRPVCGAGEVGA